MKKTFFLALAASVISASVFAQSTPDTVRRDTMDPKVPDTMIENNKNQLKEMPGPLTLEKIFPVIGTYQPTMEGTPAVSVKLDPEKKSVIWVSGLPQGTFSAMLMRSPAVYKIPAQKSDTGTDIPEGTLMYVTNMETIHIVLGKPFDFQNPGQVFTPENQTLTEDSKKVKEKQKEKEKQAFTFTGKKIVEEFGSSN